MDVETVSNANLQPASSETFARQGYALLRGLVEPPLTNFLWSYVHTKFASRLLVSGDKQVPQSLASYGDATFDGLLEYLRPRIEEHAGMPLTPTYSYFRIYSRGAELMRHRDRPACEISVTLNIGQEPHLPWPLYIEGKTGVYAAGLLPGEALLYRGMDHSHWRERYAGNRLVQAFLHYVERDGAHRDQIYDKRTTLMLSREGSTEDVEY